MRILILLIALLQAFPVFASSSSSIELAGRWPYGPAGPVSGDPDRHLVFFASGSTLIILDEQLNKLSEFVTDAVITDITSDSTHVYVANGKEAIAVNIEDAAHPVLCGRYEGSAHYLAVSGGNLYVSGGGGIIILNVSATSGITQKANIQYASGLIRIQDNYLYALSGLLSIYNISDPTNPILESSTEVSGNDFQVSGNYLYFIDWERTLKMMDISNPKAPISLNLDEISYPKNFNDPYHLYISGRYAYIGCTWGKTWIVDILSPLNPEVKGLLPTSTVVGLYTAGQKVYVSTWCEGLSAYDISDPTNGFYTFEEIADIQAAGDMAFILYSYSDQLEILDYSDPKNPRTISTINLSLYGLWKKLRISENRLYIVNDIFPDTNGIDNDLSKTIEIDSYDISEPSAPKKIGSGSIKLDRMMYLRDATFSGNQALLATDVGTVVIDLTDMNQIKEISRPSTEVGNQILVNGNHAYIREYSNELSYYILKIVNISDPVHPTPVPFNSPGYFYNMTISGNYLYMLTKDNVVRIDISDPDNPKIDKNYVLNNTYGLIGAEENAIYLRNSDGIHLFEISESSSLNPVTSYENVMTSASNILFSNKKAYFCGYSGLQVVDLSSPQTNEPLLFFETPDIITDIDVDSQILCAISGIYRSEGPGPKGFYTLDIADPIRPEEKSFYLFGYSYDYETPSLKVHENRTVFYLGYREKLVDISDPFKPFTIEGYFDDYPKGRITDFEFYNHEAFLSNNQTHQINRLDMSDLSVPPVPDATIQGDDIVISGDYGYVSDGSTLDIVNVSRPELPLEGSIDLGKTIMGVDIYPPYACVLTQTIESTESGEQLETTLLHIIDVSDPRVPLMKGSCLISNSAYSNYGPSELTQTKTGANYAYILQRTNYYALGNEVKVVNIKDPLNPFLEAPIQTLGQAFDIDLENGYLYVADGDAGISIYKNLDDTVPNVCDGIFTIASDSPLTETLQCPDSGDVSLAYELTGSPLHGKVALNENTHGQFTYTPEPGFTGTDSFTFKAVNGNIESAPASITISVESPPDNSQIKTSDSDTDDSNSKFCFIGQIFNR